MGRVSRLEPIDSDWSRGTAPPERAPDTISAGVERNCLKNQWFVTDFPKSYSAASGEQVVLFSSIAFLPGTGPTGRITLPRLARQPEFFYH
jgi:hypothetical protein